jgi:Tfp pilus assembly protein PilP
VRWAAAALGVLAGCSACGGAVEAPAPTPDAPITLHSEPSPTEPSGTAVPTGAASTPQQRNVHECPNLAGARRPLELETVQVKGIIIGARSNVAMMADSRGRTQTVRVGEYIGSRCWKVAGVGTEWVSMQRETTLDGPVGGTSSVRLYVNDPPRRDLSGR